MCDGKHTLSAEWKIGTSSSLFKELSEDDIIACKSAGVEYIEVCLRGEWFGSRKPDREAYCRRLSEKGDELGVEFWSIHLPYGHEWDISTLDEIRRMDITEKHEKLMEYALIFKARKAVIHASYEPIPETEREARLAACRKSLHQLSEKAGFLGIQLAVECLPRTCIGNSIQEIKSIIEGINLLGVCCDTNHLLKEKAEDFIRSVGSRITTLHVSDYDRVDERHWMPGEGMNDWNAIIESLEVIGYDGPIMFEMREIAENPIKPSDLKECWGRMLKAYCSSKYR